ncbi:hypothetical protein LS684_10245 [Cytobacillus spongiae]|uniref:kinase n=1 Tax=Cytobacillus spongiae TaxID=2901381 RepID=UPI001EFEF95D|nr:kinase [Cytobacillus spongiae]UII57769.1 hypothetical protein LS684_10245 [Cytobacillus spongiae]
MEHNVLNLINAIPKIKKGKKIIFGIDGLSRSGKTTLANMLKDELQKIQKIKICLFHIDDFIVERKSRYNTNYEEWYEYYYLQWDINWMKKNMFELLKTSCVITLPYYDNLSDTHSVETVNIPETCLIIIEGVFLQRKEWRDFYDFVVYIDAPKDKRLLRESPSTQNNIKKFENRYWKAEDYYLREEKPKERANLVLTN